MVLDMNIKCKTLYIFFFFLLTYIIPYKLVTMYHTKLWRCRGVMVIVVGNGHGNTSSNLDETDHISHSTNTFGKDMNPIILPLAMGKL